MAQSRKGEQKSRRTVFELSSTIKTSPFYERIVDKKGGIGGKKRGECFFSTKREKVRKRRKKSRLDSRTDTEWTRSLKVTELVLIKNLIKIVSLKRFIWKRCTLKRTYARKSSFSFAAKMSRRLLNARINL